MTILHLFDDFVPRNIHLLAVSIIILRIKVNLSILEVDFRPPTTLLKFKTNFRPPPFSKPPPRQLAT